jgi:hypothetical protein
MSDHEDGPCWQFLEDVLEELGMTADEFRTTYPHVNLDHRNDGRTVVDRNELE